MSDPDGDGTLFNADLSLFETGNFADATIVCGDRTWKVHKAILSSRCKWFKAAFFGNLAESVSGKVVFEEQNADLIDIMLRFIYTKDINIAKLAKGRGIPALSFKLFRLADFLLLQELGSEAEHAVRDYLDKMPETPNGGINDIISNPERLVAAREVIESIREAYKDDSTAYLRHLLLKSLWKRSSGIFKLPEMKVLLGEIPDLANDLMMAYISGDATTHLHDAATPTKGCLVLEAVSETDCISRVRGQEVTQVRKGIDAPCLLRPTPGRHSPFEVVDANTGAVNHELAWITPATSKILVIGCYESSEIVCVKYGVTPYKIRSMWLRFETIGDARFYTGSHSGVDRKVRQERYQKSSLLNEMHRVQSLTTQAVRT